MNPIISIRISHQRGVDAVLTDTSCNILDEFSQDCYAPDVVIPFISNQAERYPDLALVMSPSDPWPTHLHLAVEKLRVPMRWVPRQFEKEAYESAAPWRRKRRQYRARLLAHLHYLSRTNQGYPGFEAGLDWERRLAHEIVDGIGEQRSKMDDF